MNAITETVYGGEDGIQTQAEWYTGQISLISADIPPLDLDPEMTTYVGTPHNCAIAFLTEDPDRTLTTGTTMREVLETSGFHVHQKRYGDDHYIMIPSERRNEFTITQNGYEAKTQTVWDETFGQLDGHAPGAALTPAA